VAYDTSDKDPNEDAYLVESAMILADLIQLFSEDEQAK